MNARKFTPYPTYKDSGVEWLGEIPTHWEVKKVKRLCLVRRGASPRPIDDPIYFDDDGDYAWVRIADVTASERYLETTTQRLSKLGKSKSVALEPGELFLSIAATVGKPVITKIRCCIHDGFVYFVGLRENREYIYYLFSCGEPYKGLGKLGTQLNLNTDTIGDIYLPLPPRAEQQEVVRFLDRETTRVDALVAKKERVIELLQEKRTALITRAVTKGLDPNVPIKDSGVEWLGEIPAHWKLTRLRYGCSLLRDGTHQPPPRVADGYPLLSVRNIVDGKFVRLPDDSLISEQDFRALQRSFVIQEDDVLLAVVGATLGKVAMVGSQEPFAIQRSLAVLRPRPELLRNHFLALFLESQPFQNLLWQMTGYSAQPGIYLSALASFHAPAPPVGEQLKIIESVRNHTEQIDEMIDRVRDAIGCLKELRAAVVSAAVTGKIDVREEVA